MRIEDIESELRQVAESLVLADLTYRKGKIADAEPMYEKALAMLLRTYAEEHPDVDACLLRLGDIYVAREKFAQAVSTYSRLHSLRARINGVHHIETIAISFKIAKSQEKLTRYDEAAATYEEAIALGEQWLPAGHPLVGSMMESYAILLRKHKSDNQKATEIEQKAKETRKKYKGPGSTSFDLAAVKKPDPSDSSGPPITAVLPDSASRRPSKRRPRRSNPLTLSFLVLIVLVVPTFVGLAMMKHRAPITQPSPVTRYPGNSIDATTAPPTDAVPNLPPRAEPISVPVAGSSVIQPAKPVDPSARCPLILLRLRIERSILTTGSCGTKGLPKRKRQCLYLESGLTFTAVEKSTFVEDEACDSEIYY